MAAPLTVLQAVTAMRIHNETHADVFEKCHAQLPDASPVLADYLRLIKDEPHAWLRSLPPNWKCQSYFLKARAAVNAMASLHAVATAMEREDPDLLPALRATVRRRLMSKDLDAVINERRGRSTTAAPSDDRSEAPESEIGHGSDESSVGPETNPVCDAGPPVERLREACLAYCEATDRTTLAAMMRALWSPGSDYELPGEKAALLDLVPAMEDGASVSDVFRAITGRL
jgi:hypothetical protein